MSYQRKVYSTRAPRDRSTFDAADEFYMSRALELAWRAAGQTAPNPMVGAVIVKDGEIVGEGYHHRCGKSHAEVEALAKAGNRARGGVLYVSLEPCVHFGHTPPCVDSVIVNGIRRVVIPALDPDERVRGRGVDCLREAGIQVDVGCQESAAIAVNLGYYKEHLGLGPTVVLKMAVTLDGRIASRPRTRDRITGEMSLRYSHQLRASSDCVVVGLGTVLADEPQLDCRLVDCGTQPVPVVLDGALETPVKNRWSREGRFYFVVGAKGAAAGRRAALESSGARVLACTPAGANDVHVPDAIEQLTNEGLRRFLVEGGASVFTSFVRAGVWDAIYVFYAPKAFGEGGVPVISGVDPVDFDVIAVDTVQLAEDFLHRYLNRSTRDEILSRLERA